MADWLPGCLAGWVVGWLPGWLAARIESQRLLVSAPSQNAQANTTNPDDHEAKLAPELFLRAQPYKINVFSSRRELGGHAYAGLG